MESSIQFTQVLCVSSISGTLFESFHNLLLYTPSPRHLFATCSYQLFCRFRLFGVYRLLIMMCYQLDSVVDRTLCKRVPNNQKMLNIVPHHPPRPITGLPLACIHSIHAVFRVNLHKHLQNKNKSISVSLQQISLLVVRLSQLKLSSVLCIWNVSAGQHSPWASSQRQSLFPVSVPSWTSTPPGFGHSLLEVSCCVGL